MIKNLYCRSLACGQLEHRRIRTDLIEVYKIIHGLPNVNFFTFFVYSDEHRTRGHSLKLQKHRSRLDLRQHFLSERIINVWNKLDGNTTVTAPTLNCFKRHLETSHKDEWFTRLLDSGGRASYLGRPHPVSYPVSYSRTPSSNATAAAKLWSASMKRLVRRKKILLFPETWTKNRVGRSVVFTMVVLSTLSYCTRFCLCCLLVTLYFDMFCYRKNDLDDDKQLELQ